MNGQNDTVAVLGASPKRERYSNQAVRLLVEHGYRVIPVHQALETIEGLPVIHKLSDVTEKVHTLTVYVSIDVSSRLADDILRLAPKRVIFNPGAENPQLRTALEEHGVRTEEACTLVMLRTGQF